MIIKNISFEQIQPIWQHKLWPERQSIIETHSAMTWPYEGNPQPHDIEVFKYPATFFGAFIENNLVGVNSGHKTTGRHYRSRGIWVDPEYRLKGVSQELFNATKEQALKEECDLLWSIPRKTALSAYTKFGFETVGGFITTETSDANIYVKMLLI